MLVSHWGSIRCREKVANLVILTNSEGIGGWGVLNLLRLEPLPLLGGVERTNRFGHPRRVEDILDLLLRQLAARARDLDDGLAGLDRLLRDLGRLGVTDVRVERRGERDRALHVEVGALLVHRDALDAELGELPQHV